MTLLDAVKIAYPDRLELQDAVAALERELAEAKAKLNRKWMDDDLADAEKALELVQSDLDALRAENAKLKSQVASLQAHNDATVDDSQLIALAKERDELLARLSALTEITERLITWCKADEEDSYSWQQRQKAIDEFEKWKE